MIEDLPRREREVFEALCRLGQGSTAQVREALSQPLSDSAVRTLLTRLEAKRLVQRDAGSGGVLFAPAPPRVSLADGALRRMVDTFFAGSAASAATALLGMAPGLKPEEAEVLKRLIDRAETGEDR